MSHPVGTRAWAMASEGSLRNVDRRRLRAQALLARAAALPRAVRAAIGLNDRSMARIDAGSIVMPDTASAKHAADLLVSVSPPWLVNHCMRTWLWGAMLAQAGRIRFDEELFFVACSLHDLGLARAYRCGGACTACFAVRSGRLAEEFAEREGWPAERSRQLSEAISLHLNIRVSMKNGAEAHLLHEGAALDLIGARIREIGADSVASCLRRFPRLGFKENMVAVMKEEARSNPDSRAAYLASVGFVGMIRRSAWNE